MKKILLIIGLAFMFMTVNAQWSDDSKTNTLISPEGISGNTLTKTVKASDDMVYVSWTSGGLGFKTMLQLVDKDGNGVWPNGGILLSDHLSNTMTTDYTLCISPDDCAVITFSDSRNDASGSSFHPYVYKINKAGEFVYGIDGVRVPYEGDRGYRPRACATNSGNVIVGFTDATNNQVVFTKFSVDGEIMWSGLTIDYASMVNLVPSGNDGFILTYYITTGGSANLYAQKYNANGEAVWGAPVAIDASGRISSYNEPYVLSDGDNGLLVLYGISISNSEFYVMLQRVSADGDLLMGLEGVKCSDTYEIHTSGRFDVDIERGEIFVFETCYQASQDRELRVNKFNMYGETLWDSEGVAFVDKEFWGYMTYGVSHSGDGGAILVYTKSNTAVLSDIYAAKVEADGTMRWKNIPLCDVESNKSRVSCSPFFNNQVCVFWEDSRDGNDGEGGYGRIYGQNIGIDGKLGVVRTGLDEMSNISKLNIYPNPIKDYMTIDCIEGTIENVEMYDLSGRLVKSINTVNDRVDVRDLKAGMYLLKVSTSNGSVLTEKVVIR